MFGIKKELQVIQRRLEQLESAVHITGESGKRGTEELSSQVKKLAGAANRHDMAVEDLLDSWEELQEGQREEARSLSSALAREKDRQLAEAAKREGALLELAMDSSDQLYALRRAAEAAQAQDWLRQFSLAEEKLAARRMAAGLQVVSGSGIPVDYSVHTVVDTVETEQPERNGRVAEVYSCGYVCCGRILRKARVSAYRLTAPAAENNREEGAQ